MKEPVGFTSPLTSGVRSNLSSHAQEASEAIWTHLTTVRTVRLTQGDVVEFDAARLQRSVERAFKNAGRNDEREYAHIQGVIQNALQRLTQTFDGHTIPELRDVQEAVGAALVEGDLFDVARHYLRSVLLEEGGEETPAPAPAGEAARPAGSIRARRERLADERQSITHKFEIGTHTGYVTVGLYEDGRPGELFITMSKEGSTLAGLLDALAASVSIGLQYGVPLHTLVSKLSHVRFEPSGFTNNPNIRMAKSVVDYIFRWMGQRFPEAEVIEAEVLPDIVASDLAPAVSVAPAATEARPRAVVAESCRMLTPRNVYKPFEYPQYFEYFTKQNQAHWMPTEVPMENDIIDFKKNLSPAESNLIINILRFFTQSDIEVNNNYNTRLIPAFPKPEIKMMLSAFAAMESIHVWAYSYLNDSLGLPEKEYSAFLDYEAMRKKYHYIRSFDVRGVEDLAVNLGVFGGFIEGVSLFASFAILMNFPRMGKMKGVGQIVSWSIRDESLHSKAVCQLFRDLITENKHVWTQDLQQTLIHACEDMVALEDAFVDTCFSLGDVPGLKAAEVKQYVRYIADRRLNDLGLDALYNVTNPLSWLDVMINAKEHTNFFENRATEYSKGGILEDWDK